MAKQYVEYKGEPIYYNDRYFEDDEYFWEYYEGDFESAEVELCDVCKIGYNLRADSICEGIEIQMLEELEQDLDWKVKGLDELHVAIEKFLNSQTSTCYVTNGKFAIIKKES